MQKPRETKSRLLWNIRFDPVEQNATYFFVIINDKREIERIKSNILLSLGPIDNYLERTGKIGDLPYAIIRFTSWKEIQDWGKIYKGNIKNDSRLYERQKTSIDGLEEYIKKNYF